LDGGDLLLFDADRTHNFMCMDSMAGMQVQHVLHLHKNSSGYCLILAMLMVNVGENDMLGVFYIEFDVGDTNNKHLLMSTRREFLIIGGFYGRQLREITLWFTFTGGISGKWYFLVEFDG
jgi:hypothetical protein